MIDKYNLLESFENMNEEHYLRNLKSIREKYCNKQAQPYTSLTSHRQNSSRNHYASPVNHRETLVNHTFRERDFHQDYVLKTQRYTQRQLLGSERRHKYGEKDGRHYDGCYQRYASVDNRARYHQEIPHRDFITQKSVQNESAFYPRETYQTSPVKKYKGNPQDIYHTQSKRSENYRDLVGDIDNMITRKDQLMKKIYQQGSIDREYRSAKTLLADENYIPKTRAFHLDEQNYKRPSAKYADLENLNVKAGLGYKGQSVKARFNENYDLRRVGEQNCSPIKQWKGQGRSSRHEGNRFQQVHQRLNSVLRSIN